jgi:GTP-binding protein HflX
VADCHQWSERLGVEPENCLTISAIQDIGLEALLDQVVEVLAAGMVFITVQVPYDHGDLAALFYDQGTVVSASHNGQGTVIEGYLPRRWLERFRAYLI